MKLYTYEFFALGSDWSLQLFSDDPAAAHDIAAAASTEIGRIEARYSRYRENSETARINAAAAAGAAVEVDVTARMRKESARYRD